MRTVLGLLTLLVLSVPSDAKTVSLTVNWQGNSIVYPRASFDGSEWIDSSAKKFPIIDCAFRGSKTRCWKIRSRKGESEPYGKNLKFVEPIAVLPLLADQVNPVFEASETPDYFAPGKEKLVSKLEPFDFSTFHLPSYDKVTDDGPLIGQDTESTTFSAVSKTIGGTYALQTWKSLVGKLPKRECLADDYCVVVLDGSLPQRDIIAYCRVMNSTKSIGIPFNCEVVAYKRRDSEEWFLYSYNSPEQCDGCGAVAGSSCSFPTKVPLEKVAEVLIQSLKDGRTNIELKPYKKSADEISLIGQNEGTPSKFFQNYYDKSFANYAVSYVGETKSEVAISGLFNLLISVEPVAGGKSFREIGSKKGSSDSDIVWFQGEVLAILKKDISKQFGVTATCEVLPLY